MQPTVDFVSTQILRQIPDSKINEADQSAILEYFKSQKYTAEKSNAVNSSYSFWNALSVRTIDIDTFPAYYLNQKVSQVEYAFRHDCKTRWHWRDLEITPLIQKIVLPYIPMFLFFTRVKIHLQQPNTTVHFHRDLCAGQRYQEEIYQMYPWIKLQDFPENKSAQTIWQRNSFSLKIPLTENPGYYGRQTVFDQKPLFYTTNGNAYLLNENCDHGSEAVPYLRGLIFIDGILNPEAAAKMAYGEVPCWDYNMPAIQP